MSVTCDPEVAGDITEVAQRAGVVGAVYLNRLEGSGKTPVTFYRYYRRKHYLFLGEREDSTFRTVTLLLMLITERIHHELTRSRYNHNELVFGIIYNAHARMLQQYRQPIEQRRQMLEQVLNLSVDVDSAIFYGEELGALLGLKHDSRFRRHVARLEQELDRTETPSAA